jgi:uncharacterized phiE125 gp8 family phage protein
MKFKLKTAPVLYPITLNEAKKQCEIGSETFHDDYIEGLIAAATDQAEQYLHRRLITQTWYLYLDQWPSGTFFKLPFGRLQSVTSVKHKDEDGVESTMSSGEYIVDIQSEPGQIVLDYNESWPTDTLYPSNPITIEFVCGYGLTGASVPAMIKHAIKLTISDLFENRETEVYAMGHKKLGTWEALLFPYKLFGGVF